MTALAGAVGQQLAGVARRGAVDGFHVIAERTRAARTAALRLAAPVAVDLANVERQAQRGLHQLEGRVPGDPADGLAAAVRAMDVFTGAAAPAAERSRREAIAVDLTRRLLRPLDVEHMVDAARGRFQEAASRHAAGDTAAAIRLARMGSGNVLDAESRLPFALKRFIDT